MAISLLRRCATYLLVLFCSIPVVCESVVGENHQPKSVDPQAERLARDVQFYRALRAKVDFRIERVALSALPSELKRQARVNVRIDDHALRKADRANVLNLPISTDYHQIECLELLKRLAHACDLVLYLDLQRNFVLSDAFHASNGLHHIDGILLLAYDVEALLTPFRMRDRIENPEQSLIDILQSTVAPATWESVGGAGRMEFKGGKFIIEQSLWNQEAVAEMLAALHRSRHLAQTWDGRTPPPTEISYFFDPDDETNLETKLRTEVKLRFAGGTLRSLAKQLSRENKMEVQLDHRELRDIGMSPDTQLAPYELPGASLGPALRHLLRQYDLTYDIRGNVLLITSPNFTYCGVETKILPIFDLCHGKDEKLGAEPEELISLIENVVRPGMWEKHGGPNSMRYVPQAGCLIVSHDLDEPEAVGAFLSRYRQLVCRYAGNPMTAPTTPLTVHYTQQESVISDRLRAAKVTCDVRDVPLADVVRRLRRQTRLPLMLSRSYLEHWGHSRDVKVTATAQDAALRDVLHEMLRPIKLTHCVTDGAIVILPAEHVPLERVIYPIADITQRPPRSLRGSPVEAAQLIAQKVRETAPPGSWEARGGPGDVYALPSAIGLVVTQSPDAHYRIEKVVEKLRRSVRYDLP